MKLRFKVTFLILVLALSACVSKYKQVELSSTAIRPQLSIEDSVFVATPENGRYGSTLYTASGSYTADAFRKAFSRQVKDVYLEGNPQSFEESLKNAQEKGYKKLAYPEIEHWEDRATEWSSKPDRIEIKVRIADVSSGEVLDTILLVGSSKWATMGGDHPQELLEKPVTEYVDSLYKASFVGSGA